MNFMWSHTTYVDLLYFNAAFLLGLGLNKLLVDFVNQMLYEDSHTLYTVFEIFCSHSIGIVSFDVIFFDLT